MKEFKYVILMSGFCGTAHEFVAQEVGVSIPVGTGGED